MKRLRLVIVHLALVFPFLCGIRLAAQPANPLCTGNETWMPVGSGLEGEAAHSIVMDDGLYVIHEKAVPSQPGIMSIQISRWDGSSWTDIANATARSVKEQYSTPTMVTSFINYKGEFYVGGAFESVNDIANTQGVVKWNGSTWAPVVVPEGFTTVYAMAEYRDELYITGHGKNGYGRIVKGDGSTWGTPGDGKIAGYIETMAVGDGKLYVGGNFDNIDNGMHTLGIAMWDGNSWSRSFPFQLFSIVHSLIYHNGKLFAYTDLPTENGFSGRFTYWDGASWHEDSQFADNDPITEAKFGIHNGELYVYGTTNDTLENGLRHGVAARWDGSTWTRISGFVGSPRFMTSYDGALYAGGQFTRSCGPALNHIAYLCNNDNCARITGTIYHDLDTNCTQDAGENGLPQRIVEILPGPFYAVSDEHGNYSQYVHPGAYTVTMLPYLHWERSCPVSGEYSVTIANQGSHAGGNDFAATPIPGIQDIRVSIVASRARQGRQLTYAIRYENKGTVVMDGTIRLALDPLLRFDSAQTAITRIASNIAEWEYTGLGMDEARTIMVWATVPIETPMGTLFCAQVEATPVQNNFSNTTRDSVCVPVTGSFDPNDIQVTPLGIEDNGVISANDSTLTYWVRFQNTGNDTAFKVVVVDSLPPHLDITSITLGAASHPFSFSINSDNALVWTFNDIMLPDSAAHQLNSNGFFKFSIRLKPHLPIGTEIANRVHIYFDHNEPVTTNTVVSVIGSTMGVEENNSQAAMLAIYPNPAHGIVHLSGEIRRGGQVIVRDLLGRTISSHTHDGSGRITIDATSLPAGIYVLQAETPTGIALQRFLVVH